MRNDRSPIIIIGAARSGTKFLRDCLKGDPRVCVVPYDVNYIWRFGQPMSGDDVLSPSALSERQVEFIRKALAKQAGLEPGGILVEKTVSNTLRVPLVNAVFPDALFVHLLRDGRDVAASAMKEWSASPDYGRLRQKLRRAPLASLPYLLWFARHSLFGTGRARGQVPIWGPRYPGIEADVDRRSLAEVCAIQWRESVETARRDLGALPADRVFEIRYEDLVRDDAAIRRLTEGLSLDSEAIAQTFSDTVRPIRSRPLTDETIATRAAIEAVLNDTLHTLGYAEE